MRRKKKQCEGCLLFDWIEVPYYGDWEISKIVYIGESPGKNEEIEGEPFVGKAGDLIKRICIDIGLRWTSMFIMNSARCRIDKKEFGIKKQNLILGHCRQYVVRAIRAVEPKLIIVAGDFALRQILKKSGVKQNHGKLQWSDEFGCWVMPTYHPASVFRVPEYEAFIIEDLKAVVEFIKNGYKPLLEQTGTNYQEVNSIKDIIKAEKPTAIDTEAQGYDWVDPEHITISASFSITPGTGVSLLLYEECPVEKADITIMWKRLPKGEKRPKLVPVHVKKARGFERKLNELEVILKSKTIKKYMMNGNYDVHSFTTLFLRERGYRPEINNYVMDVQAAGHLLDENTHKMASLDHLQRFFTGIKADYNRQFEMKYNKADMLAVLRDNPKDFHDYACADGDITLQVAMEQRRQLMRKENRRLLNYFIKFVMPTLRSLFILEENGCPVDRKNIPVVEKRIYKLMMDAQIKALKQIPRAVKDIPEHKEKNRAKAKKDKIILSRDSFIRDVVFHSKGFKQKVNKRTKGGDPCIDKGVRTTLLDGALPQKCATFLRALNDFKEYHTLWSRYIRGFEKHIRHDDRIHSSLSLVIPVTGRVSSSSPNLMNNPKRSKSAKEVRRLIAAPPGWRLCEADESQSELRWLAHVANELAMIKIFKDAKRDIHVETAKDLVDKPWSSLDAHGIWKARRDAKSVNFGLIFGMTAGGFVKYAKEEYEIDIGFDQAQAWMDIFFNKYPRIPIYHENIVEEARDKGYVESALGRRRRLPAIHSDIKMLRFEAERQAINHPIQSPSSDTVLLAFNEMLREDIFHPDEFLPVLFIHDSLVFMIKENSKLDDHVKSVIQFMENPPLKRDFDVRLSVPLKADAELGQNLAEMKEYKFAA